MLGNSINIKNFNWNPVVLKKFAKTSKNYHFLAQLLQKRGPHGPRAKQNTIFFSEIKKADYKFSKPFYFNKISYFVAELSMFFYFV